jgi:hypothetical protein
MARFLEDVPAAWAEATPEQRNKLARCLFDQVWLKDKKVVALKPASDLEPFFQLNYEDFCKRDQELGSKIIDDRSSSRVGVYLKHEISQNG